MPFKKTLKFATVGVLVLAVVSLIIFFTLRERGQADIGAGQAQVSLQLKSSDFVEGGLIPMQLTCMGADLSPELEFGSPPTGTKSFAIVMNDPDSPFGFVHWLVYNIPRQVRVIEEGASLKKQLPPGAMEGANGADTRGYLGACPPGRQSHHYVIRVYALDTEIGVAPGITKQQLASAVTGHVLAEGQLSGIYGRDRN